MCNLSSATQLFRGASFVILLSLFLVLICSSTNSLADTLLPNNYSSTTLKVTDSTKKHFPITNDPQVIQNKGSYQETPYKDIVNQHFKFLNHDLQILTLVVTIITVVTAVVSIFFTFLSWQREKRIEDSVEKQMNSFGKHFSLQIDSDINHNIQEYLNSKYKNDLSRIKMSIDDQISSYLNKYKQSEQNKNIVLSHFNIDLFNSILKIVGKNHYSKDELLIEIKKHLDYTQNLILLYMPNEEDVISGLNFFKDNPSPYLKSSILENLKNDFPHSLQMIEAINKIKVPYEAH